MAVSIFGVTQSAVMHHLPNEKSLLMMPPMALGFAGSKRSVEVEVQTYPKEIRIFEAGQRMASHPILHGKHQSRLDPSHRRRHVGSCA
ncbi:MAG: hypothetical protein AAGA73_07770 [Pseudomonadota bacterium]